MKIVENKNKHIKKMLSHGGHFIQRQISIVPKLHKSMYNNNSGNKNWKKKITIYIL